MCCHILLLIRMCLLISAFLVFVILCKVSHCFLYRKAGLVFLEYRLCQFVTFADVCSMGLFKVAAKNSCLSQSSSSSAGGGPVMVGLTNRKTERGSTLPSVSALYNAVRLTGVQTLP